MSVNDNVEHFKCDVRRFDSIDLDIKKITDSIKPLNVKLKELKSSKNELQTKICNFMEINEIAECKLADGALLFKESKNVIPLSKNAIHENIKIFLKDKSNTDEYKKASIDEKASMIFSFVYENREYNEKKLLKRV